MAAAGDRMPDGDCTFAGGLATGMAGGSRGDQWLRRVAIAAANATPCHVHGPILNVKKVGLF
jgi:hypothetical protein